MQPEHVSRFLLRSNTQTVTPTLVIPNTLYTSDLSVVTVARCLLLLLALLCASPGHLLRARKRGPARTQGQRIGRSSS